MCGFYGPVVQPKASKPEVPDSTPGSYCVSIMHKHVYQELNKRYIKTQETNITICIVFSGALAVIYNMYKSMTSRGVHLYPLFIWYSIYIRFT